MKTIGWMGCLGFALVGLFQQSVINTMEKNYMESAKYSIPIVKETNKSKVIETSSYSPVLVLIHELIILNNIFSIAWLV